MSSAIAKKLEKTMGEEGDANCNQCANGCTCTSGKSPACMQRQLCTFLLHFADLHACWNCRVSLWVIMQVQGLWGSPDSSSEAQGL